jgi:hypothetical protein
MLKKIALIFGFLVIAVSPSYALEKRCGWLDNPTPANWFLVDRNETWTISAQGGYQARGITNISDLSEKEYVTTNGSYGYACACMGVTTDKRLSRILSIQNFTQLPLRRCREDRSLPAR